MPAFTFEKISPPAQLETAEPTSPTVRRGALLRFLDRLTSARLRRSENGVRRLERPRHKRARNP